MRSKLPASGPSSGAWIRIALALLIASIVPDADAALTGKIKGSVEDQAGATVPGIELNFFPAEGGLPRKLETDKKGRFSHNFFPAGSYRVELADSDAAYLKSMRYVLRDPGGIEVMREQGDANPESGFPPFRVGPDQTAELLFVIATKEQQAKAAEAVALASVSDELKDVAARFAAGDMQAVLDKTRRLIEKNPDLASAHYLEGMALSRLDRLDEAETSLRTALSQGGDQPGVEGALGTVLLRQGQALSAADAADQARPRYDEARTLLKKELDRTPDALPLLMNYAAALEHSDPDRELPGVLDQLMAAEPERRSQHLRRLAKWHYDRGDLDQALATLRQIPRTDAAGASVAYSIAAKMFNDGQVTAATEVAELGLEFDASNADLYRLLARAYLSEDRRSDAVTALKRFLELRPDDPEAAVERDLLQRLEALEHPKN